MSDMKQEVKNRPKFSVLNLPVARPAWRDSELTEKEQRILTSGIIDPNFASFAEPTGNGDTLCYLAYSARFCRCSESHIRKAVHEYIEEYKAACRMYDEDPAHEYFDVFNLNDFYKKLPIIPSHFGDKEGYSISEDYRQIINWEVTRLKVDELENTSFAKFHEDIIVVEPLDSYSYPNEFYMEV